MTPENNISLATPPISALPSTDSAALQHIMEQNLAATRSLELRVMAIQRWIFWQRIWTWIKIALIVVPLIVTAFYLPSIMSSIAGPYQSLLQGSGTADPSYLNTLLNQKK